MVARVVTPLVVVLLLAADEPAKNVKDELNKLQGDWTMVSDEMRGRKLPDRVVQQARLTIKEDHWMVVIGKADGKGSTTIFKIDPSKDPKTIDLHYKSADQENTTLGIYKLEGDTLTICRTFDGSERPKEFKTTDEEGNLTVWKRVKK